MSDTFCDRRRFVGAKRFARGFDRRPRLFGTYFVGPPFGRRQAFERGFVVSLVRRQCDFGRFQARLSAAGARLGQQLATFHVITDPHEYRGQRSAFWEVHADVRRGLERPAPRYRRLNDTFLNLGGPLVLRCAF